MRYFKPMLAGLLCLAFAAATAPSSAATPSTKFNLWHWNVAGSWQLARVTHEGRATTIASSISSPNQLNDFATVNELCYQQYKLIQDKLRAKGWPQDTNNFSRWSQTLPANSGRCSGQSVGNAVFSKKPLVSGDAGRIIYNLPKNDYIGTDKKDDYQRTLMCVTPAAYTTVRVCVTHVTYLGDKYVSPGLTYRQRQLTFILNKLETMYSEGLTVILAGDLNAGANFAELNAWYSPAINSYTAMNAEGKVVTPNGSNTGKYREVDDNDVAHCRGYGQRTIEEYLTLGPCSTGVKLDYIFVREDRLASSDYQGLTASPDSVNCDGPCSDHRVLRGSVTVKY